MRLAPLLLLPLLLTSCSSGTANAKPEIVVGAYPFQWLVEQVAGPDVRVTNLVKPGVEPHDIELTPRQVAQVKGAKVVFYLKGFQPALDDAVAGVGNAYDLGAVLKQVPGDEGLDPHVWLDPVLMKAMATEVASVLNDTVAWEGAGYAPGTFTSAGVDTRLAALDRDITAQLKSCRSTSLVTSHAAFGYFAARYGLVQRGIAGLSPESEPSPGRLAEIARFARANHVTTIFFESLVSPKLARTVAAEVGAMTAVLDPIENVQGSDDYLSVMRRNAAAVHTALGCA